MAEMQRFSGALRIPGIAEPVAVDPASLQEIASKYLFAVEEAGRVYRHIVQQKGEGNFVTEVSFDEANAPQTPAELLFILAAVAREAIPVATVAPKFTGEFLKGIDYVGDIKRFAREFEEDLAVLEFAKQSFTLPPALKLSIHSGSDKFSLYPIMHRAIKKAGAGLHLKTAGTTWLEEVIGLAAAGGEGLAFAKALYHDAYGRYDEMAKPLSHGHRHRPPGTAHPGPGGFVERPGIRGDARTQPGLQALQHPLPPDGAHQLPGCRREAGTIPGFAQIQSRQHRIPCLAQHSKAPYRTSVSRNRRVT